LYNGYAINNAYGLCPTGWHVSSDAEWTELTDYIGGTGEPYGNKLKSCRQVNSPLGGGCFTNVHPRWVQHNINYGTDDYGFSGLPGGYRYANGAFFNSIDYLAYWWSSTETSSSEAWHRGLIFSYGYIVVDFSLKRVGFSVRCIKD